MEGWKYLNILYWKCMGSHSFREKMKAWDCGKVLNYTLRENCKKKRAYLAVRYLTHTTSYTTFAEDNRHACGKFVRRVVLSIEEVRLAASHFPSSKRGCRKLMIDDSLTAPAAAAQSTSRRKCATSFVAEEAFCRSSQSTARSRLIYGLPRNSQQWYDSCAPSSGYFEIHAFAGNDKKKY